MLGIKGLFGAYWLALFVTSLCANLIGLNISSAFNSAITIYIIIPLLMIPMMVLSGAMFSFDKLNRDIGNIDKVPLIAEAMPTRWTYEALMVKQATGNEYDKRVYSLKKEISVSDFISVYRISRLNDALDESIKEKKYSIAGNISSQLELLRNELKFLEKNYAATPFNGKDSLTSELFTTALGERLKNHLSLLEKEYVRRSNKADDKLDAYIGNNKEALSKLFDDYHNDKLEEIMRKIYEKNKILEYDGRLIQNIDPVYQDPFPSGIFEFRCHFLSPVKKFLGFTIGTFIFNISLVLFSVIILYVLLYYEVLTRIINGIEKIRIQK